MDRQLASHKAPGTNEDQDTQFSETFSEVQLNRFNKSNLT